MPECERRRVCQDFVQATTVAPVVFELRQVRLPVEWSQWQRAMWLDSQALLWGELGIVLDGAGGVVESGADAVSNGFAAQSNATVGRLIRGGESVPDDYVAAVDAVVSRVSTPDTAAGMAIDLADSGGGRCD
jgi:hypothetical protein